MLRPTPRPQIAVAIGNDRLFARLCEAVGVPELASDERYATNSARVANADSLAHVLLAPCDGQRTPDAPLRTASLR